MINNFVSSGALLKNAQKNDVYGKLVAQLNKDFGLANIRFDISVKKSGNDLEELLHEKIYYLIMERFSDYLNLLYIIDVPEYAFKKIDRTDSVDVAKQVTFLILKRELQKVLLKMKYS